MITFACKNCGTKLTVSDDHMGKKGKCPTCGDLNTIAPLQEVRSEGPGPMTQVSDVAPASSSGTERAVPSQQPGRSRMRIWLALIAGAAFLVIVALVVFWWLPGREEGRLAEARESASQLADDQAFRQMQEEVRSALLMQALGETGDVDKARKAYRKYLEQYPNGHHSSEARNKRDELEKKLVELDDRAFAAAESRAKAAGDDFPTAITAYKKYLQQYPNGHHLSEAGKKLDELDDRAFAAAESRAKAAGDDFPTAITAYKKYLAKYPNGRHLSEAGKKLDELDDRVVAAAESRAKAEKAARERPRSNPYKLSTRMKEEAIPYLQAMGILPSGGGVEKLNADVRVSDYITVKNVPMLVIAGSFLMTRTATQAKLMFERGHVRSKNWLVTSWILNSGCSYPFVMQRGKASKEELIRTDAQVCAMFRGKLTVQPTKGTPAYRALITRKVSPGGEVTGVLSIEWLLFPFDTQEHVRMNVSLRKLVTRFEPNAPVTDANADAVAEELTWTNLLGISDGTYKSLPQARRVLQTWILEPIGFEIGDPADSDPQKRQRALQALDEAKKEFFNIWDKAFEAATN